MRQINIGKWWGTIKLLGQNISSYINWLVLAFSGITAYATAISPFLLERNIALPFWIFALVVVALIGLLSIFEWTLSLPSFFATWNHQWWNHENPAKAKLEKLETDIAELKTLIKSMQK